MSSYYTCLSLVTDLIHLRSFFSYYAIEFQVVDRSNPVQGDVCWEDFRWLENANGVHAPCQFPDASYDRGGQLAFL